MKVILRCKNSNGCTLFDTNSDPHVIKHGEELVAELYNVNGLELFIVNLKGKNTVYKRKEILKFFEQTMYIGEKC